MEISGVKFGNVDDDNHIIDNYGNKLYASEVKYLKPQLSYKGLSTSEKEVTLYVKILKEDGTLEKGNSSPEGYTYKYDFTVKPGSNQTATLSGWGRNSGGSYSPGQYTFEIWYKDKVEKPREFDPRGQATMTPAGKNTLTPYGKIKMTPENDCFSGAFL